MANGIKPISELSDEELMAEYQKSNRPISELSDEELAAESKKLSGGAVSVVNEPADISAFDRAFVKNFGGTEDEQASWLQQKYPDMQVQVYNGEVVAKKPDEKSFKRLDPGGWQNLNPVEMAKDAFDAAYDIGAGAISTAAGAGAGLAAAPTFAGALPAAALASGTTSAAAEALRQAIGKYSGAMGDVSGGQIATSGLLGAAGPLLFGTGAAGKQIASKIAQPGVVGKLLGKTGGVVQAAGPTEEQIAKATAKLAETQQGLLGRVSDKALNVFSNAAPKETLENAVKDVDPKAVNKLVEYGLDIDPSLPFTNQELALALREQGKIEVFGDMAANTVYDSIQKKQREIGNQISSGLKETGKKFDVAALKKPLEDIIDATKNSNIPAVKAKADAARKVLNEYFGAKMELGTKHVYDANKKRLSLKDIQPGGPYKGKIYDAKGQEIERRLGRSGKSFEVSADEAMNLNNALSSFIDYTKSPIALDKTDAAQRQVRAGVIEAKNNLQAQIYDALEKGKTPKLRELYAENRQFLRDLFPKFSSPEKTVQTLLNINNKSNIVLKERLKKLDQKNNTNMLQLAELADVAKYFGDPSLEVVSGQGATSTGRILRAGELAGTGAWAAGLATGIPGVAPAAGQVGRAAGGLLASPAAVAKYLSAKTATRRGLEKVGAGEVVRQISKAKQQLPQSLQPAISATGAYQTGLMGEGLSQAGQIPLSLWQLMTGGNE